MRRITQVRQHKLINVNKIEFSNLIKYLQHHLEVCCKSSRKHYHILKVEKQMSKSKRTLTPTMNQNTIGIAQLNLYLMNIINDRIFACRIIDLVH